MLLVVQNILRTPWLVPMRRYRSVVILFLIYICLFDFQHDILSHLYDKNSWLNIPVIAAFLVCDLMGIKCH